MLREKMRVWTAKTLVILSERREEGIRWGWGGCHALGGVGCVSGELEHLLLLYQWMCIVHIFFSWFTVSMSLVLVIFHVV
jgi:hypothetical protein